MLIKNCIYFIIMVINLLSVPILICSVKNKDKNTCKDIIIIDIVYLLYLVINLIILPNILRVPYGLEIFIFILMSLISAIIYIISIVMCLIKIKKNKTKSSKIKRIKLLMIILILFPVLFLFSSYLKESYLINNSDLILIYHSSGNGGFGDGKTFAYAISDKYCKEFSLGIDLDGYYFEKFLSKVKTFNEITGIENINNYDVITNDDNILVYKNGKLIHKNKINSDYFNISFKRGFYKSMN